MDRCARCILPDNFPGVRFDESGVCNVCLGSPDQSRLTALKTRYLAKFEALLAERRGQGEYDFLVCYSGGKDSTFTLDVLKNRFGASVLAFTLDNGFISAKAQENIRTVVDNLGIDLFIFRPDAGLLRKIFSRSASEVFYPVKSLERASTICTSCISFVKFPSLKMAIEKAIPFMGFGWSPGQAPVQSSVMKTNPELMRATQQTVLQPLRERFGRLIEPYFLSESHFQQADRFPYNVHPLAFLDYNEEKILERIKELGWEKPADTDPNSTNCLLNAYANEVHERQFGYNPYLFEIANMVRTGVLSREEGLAKFSAPPAPEYVSRVRDILKG